MTNACRADEANQRPPIQPRCGGASQDRIIHRIISPPSTSGASRDRMCPLLPRSLTLRQFRQQPPHFRYAAPFPPPQPQDSPFLSAPTAAGSIAPLVPLRNKKHRRRSRFSSFPNFCVPVPAYNRSPPSIHCRVDGCCRAGETLLTPTRATILPSAEGSRTCSLLSGQTDIRRDRN